MAELIALRTAYRCDSCDEIWDETLGEPLYECGRMRDHLLPEQQRRRGESPLPPM